MDRRQLVHLDITHLKAHCRLLVPARPLRDGALVAPSEWFHRVALPAEGEPAFADPCVVRRGRVEERDGVFLHFCADCGAWGAFGYGVNLRAGWPGRWYCAEHRPQGVEAGRLNRIGWASEIAP